MVRVHVRPPISPSPLHFRRTFSCQERSFLAILFDNRPHASILHQFFGCMRGKIDFQLQQNRRRPRFSVGAPKQGLMPALLLPGSARRTWSDADLGVQTLRARGGCLGGGRRRRTRQAAKSPGETHAVFDPGVSEWGNPVSHRILPLLRRDTRRSETSQ